MITYVENNLRFLKNRFRRRHAAKVIDTIKEPEGFTLNGDEEVVSLHLYKEVGANTIDATAEVDRMLGILASTIVMWVSRQREFRADAGSAELNGAQPMIRALARLERGTPAHLPESLEAFGISSSERHGIQRLFMSHPPIPERIDALQRS